MISKKKLLLLFLLLMGAIAGAQNYHAIQGSSYAGALGVHNNPASIVNTPYKWDVALIGVQAKVSTNILSIRNYSLLSKPSNSEYFFTAGEYKRKGIVTSNINLLNSRIALGKKAAIAFGANLRAYADIRSEPYHFYDTLKKVGDFLKLNESNQPLGASFVNSAWIELYASYAQTIFDNETGRLNAGATVKLSRGISGAQASLGNGRFNRTQVNNQTIYQLTNVVAQYGYSSNYDRWNNSNSTGENLRNFLTYTEGGASIDIGAEYLIKTEAVSTAMEEDDYFDYDWKLGISLLDLGVNQYKYGVQSRRVTGIKANATDISVNNKMDSTIRSIRVFNDSLATVADVGGLSGKFRIINPTRLVLNADRYLTGNFFVNAELSVNLS